MKYPEALLTRDPKLHVCGVERRASRPPWRPIVSFRAWFKDGWKGPQRIRFEDAVSDLEIELHRRADTLPRQPAE